MTSRLTLVLQTCWRLGVRPVASVTAYRVACKSGLFKLLQPIKPWTGGNLFFKSASRSLPLFGLSTSCCESIAASANLLLAGQLDYFSHWRKQSGSPPDWFHDPFSGNRLENYGHWSELNEFSSADIKAVWEPSRFEWVLLLVRAWQCCGDRRYLDTLNSWLADWIINNPTNAGPNWKCAQEASIRVMHLTMAALILGQTEEPANDLVALIRLHLQRIAPTIAYAIAQNNNHGTSEAAALFIGGSWLESLGQDGGKYWHRLGRKWLENRVTRLIEPDGSFSQYSVNYHRVMLDTLSMAEIWRRHLGLVEFSSLMQSRAQAASRWLHAMVDAHSGDAPNLGANDGARLLPLTTTDYRDFRPAVQLAMALFNGERAYADDGPWNTQLAWLGVVLPDRTAPWPVSRLFDDGGYGLLKRGDAMALLRYPRFRFRPGHADALHVDLWRGGENLLRDAGTFSYNTDPEWLDFFPGTASHNTVQFDNRDQMPRLSRFLFGNWLKTESLQPLLENAGEVTCGAAIRDSKANFHQRSVRLLDDRLLVQDEVTGFADTAVLRWRVRPGDWYLQGQTLTDGEHRLSVQSSVPIARFELVSGWESRYYLHKTSVPVLEVEIRQPGTFTTEYCWVK